MPEMFDKPQETKGVETKATDAVLPVRPDETDTGAGLRRCVLANGMEVAYQSKAELAHFYEDIFEKQVYLKHGVTLHEGECVFDVGSNIGLFTLFTHRKVNNLRIYAFEPAPPLFRILSFNTALHKVNVKLFNCGVSNEAKTATFTFYPQSSGMSSFYADKQEEKEALRAIMLNQLHTGMEGMEQLMQHAEDLLEARFKSESFECRLRPLSEIIREEGVERIDLMKIDVQKSELDVLEGLDAADWPKVRQIVIEVHDLAGRLNQITTLLKERGFNVRVEQDDMYEGSILYNLFAVRPASMDASWKPALTPAAPPSFQQIHDRAKKQEAALNQQKQQMKLRRKGL
ncbi:MAG TPA: FkbM family methyltransferase [Pyrinomonadaceae bacterium]|jgi:FkbM family methyltransferase